MTTFLITLAVLGIFIVAMAVGVILSNKPLQGSCGGLGRIMGDDCDFCDKKEECPRLKKIQENADAADAADTAS